MVKTTGPQRLGCDTIDGSQANRDYLISTYARSACAGSYSRATGLINAGLSQVRLMEKEIGLAFGPEADLAARVTAGEDADNSHEPYSAAHKRGN